jgi:hypothetical protein
LGRGGEEFLKANEIKMYVIMWKLSPGWELVFTSN